MKVNIYALIDPETNKVRYVGKTRKSIEKRLAEHLEPYRLRLHNYKNHWIKSLLEKGLTPKIELISEVPEDNWQYWECYYISLYEGLTNLTAGGEGNNNLAEVCRKQISEKNSKKIIQYTLSGEFIKIWNSGVEACRFYNLKSTTINSAANPNNRKKSSCGFLWRMYTEDYPLQITPPKDGRSLRPKRK